MFSLLPLLIGLLMVAASLTPSLVPRDWIMQGVLAGMSMAAGYLVTQFLLAIWRTLELPLIKGRAATVIHVALAVPILFTLIRCVALADVWQNDIRSAMGLPLVQVSNTTKMLAVGTAVFLVLFVLGAAIQGLFDLLRTRLARHIPVRSANVLGLLLAGLIVLILTRDGVVDAGLRLADSSYAAAQHLTDPTSDPPSQPWQSGARESLVDWDLMGKPGRDFVMGAPPSQEIADFSGRTALEPLRIYVGLAQSNDPTERARLALAEAKRVGAFDRKVLVLASPTGTGWMDPASYAPLEFMHGGDVATIAVQYSYLQSPLALIFETEAGLEQATASMQIIYDHWRSLPPQTRPRLYLHGISLGAWSSMYSFNPFQMMNEPVSGAFWVGPPFTSTLWRQANEARNPGSPYVLPEIDRGEVIRYASQYAPPDRSGLPWGRLRILFLQHASDPIVFYSPSSLWRPPEWMNDPPAADLAARLSFTPIVTQLQLGLDMMVSTSTPPGFGHNYAAAEYIDGWAAVAPAEGWSSDDTARLKEICTYTEGRRCRVD